jgi:DNA-binding transcriptional LysR family regulator
MELLSLRTFQAVVEEGGINAASVRLNTVQSNITTRIKRLEEELGATLFYRKGRGLELAPSGHVLLNYTQQLLHLESQAITAVRQVGEQTGQLRIGSMESFTALHLPNALKALRQYHSGLELKVETNTSSDLIDRVCGHKLDCAFVGGKVDHPDLLAEEVLNEELVLVRSKQAENKELPLIVFREGCTYRARALAWQRESGKQADNNMELGTLDGILGCVGVGLGYTLMPRSVIKSSRFYDDLLIEKVPPHIANVPTMMVRHRLSSPLKALDTLKGEVMAFPQSIAS